MSTATALAQIPSVMVHPDGRCESESVGPGTRVWGFAHVMAGATVGSHCNICSGAFVESGARIGDRCTIKNGVLVFEGVDIADDVFVGPGVIFTNDLRPRAHITRSGPALVPTHVEEGVTLGAGTVVVCGVRIGHDAFSAAGAVITRDVPPHAFVAGNPARQIDWVCRCGERLQDTLGCACGRRYHQSTDGLEELTDDDQ